MSFRQVKQQQPVLGRNCVHVWRARIEPMPDSLAEVCASVLSRDERARAERFCAKSARETFEAGRGILRILLGHYLDRDPAGIRFTYSRTGKPSIAGQGGASGLQFNVSHAAGLALYAFGRGMPLGIDIEKVRAGLDVATLVARFFSPAETAQFASVPKPARRAAFYACWTRKEAVLKAKGIGILRGLRQFDVMLMPGSKPRLLHCAWRGEDPGQWSLCDIDAGRGFRAALAVKAPRPRVTCYRWVGPCGRAH